MEAEVLERAVFTEVYGRKKDPKPETQDEKARRITDYIFKKLGVEKMYISHPFVKTPGNRDWSKADIVQARRLAIAMIYEYCDLRLAQFNEIFRLHHATILYHKQMHEDLCFSDRSYRKLTRETREELRAI